jgi:hypothetical protein
MKRISSSFLWAVAKLCAILAAILGCSSKGAPEKPREIRWKGQDSGYENTTTVRPADNAGSTDKK